MKKENDSNNENPSFPERKDEHQEIIGRVAGPEDKELAIRDAIETLNETDQFMIIALKRNEEEGSIAGTTCVYGDVRTLIETFLKALGHNPRTSLTLKLTILKYVLMQREDSLGAFFGGK